MEEILKMEKLLLQEKAENLKVINTGFNLENFLTFLILLINLKKQGTDRS